MKQYFYFLAASLVFIFAACSSQPESYTTIVKGEISLADSTRDFTGTGITIVAPDTSAESYDTLYYAETNAMGSFEGHVQFSEKKYYNLILSRDSTDIVDFGVILADNDTLTVTAQLPNIQQTLNIDSYEHNAMKTYNRVDRSFQRISLFARTGTLSDSQLVSEVQKWSDFYWDVYEKYPNTMASDYAAEKSIHLLSSWNREEMLDRVDKALPSDYIMNVALNYAYPYVSESQGFDAASSYLDSLSSISDSDLMQDIIERTKIQLYFDSSKVKQAKDLLENYEQNFADNSSSKKWARRIRYDLNYLAPGVQAPDFSFVTMNGDTVNNTALEGNTYILEITPLASKAYQDDYDRTLIIHEIYKNYGLKIFTIPLDESELTVEGFFEGRRKAWGVAKMGSFDIPQIIQKFNVVQVPTRLLIDENGVLIRKYERGEFEDVIQGLNKAFKNQNSPS